jgi:hypothetical protein
MGVEITPELHKSTNALGKSVYLSREILVVSDTESFVGRLHLG